ncbi:unannotated protein [freshwater metagenome]|uniref:Unannotated protein n=1 Tax=freshwater metagenome TaxID=449393 RepID=A0A6J6ZJA8_9ZZZZ
MVDLEYRGDCEQYQETEVDHGVHDSCSRVTEKSLHVEASPKACHTGFAVLRRDVSLVGSATFPVAHSVREHDGAIDKHHGDDRVEGQLEGSWDVVEYLTLDSALVVELENGCSNSRERNHESNGNADDDCDLIRPQSGRPRDLVFCVLSLIRFSHSHNGYELIAGISD